MSFIKVSSFSQRELQGKGYLCPSYLGIIATPSNNAESLL